MQLNVFFKRFSSILSLTDNIILNKLIFISIKLNLFKIIFPKTNMLSISH